MNRLSAGSVTVTSVVLVFSIGGLELFVGYVVQEIY
jgi:hypothetical protein